MRKCPVCASAEVRPVGRFTSEEVAEHHFNNFAAESQKDDLRRSIESIWGGPTAERCACESCGVRFCWPFEGGDGTFYELSSADTNYPQRKWEFDRTVRALRERGAAGATVLEFGAGDGGFLRTLTGNGWDRARLTALEFSSSGMQRLRAEGFACHSVDIRAYESARTYDAVCMFQVLEHLSDLDGVFAKLDALTHRDSSVFIAVPNRAWIEDNQRIGLGNDYPPNHVTQWTPQAFERLAGLRGWRLAEADLEPPDRWREAKYAIGTRYLQGMRGKRSLHRRLFLSLRGRRRPPLVRAAKLALALSQPACLAAGLRRFVRAPSPNIWVHLRRA